MRNVHVKRCWDICDWEDAVKYRPISNLSAISEVLEKLSPAQPKPSALLELLISITAAGDDRRFTV